jgi:hypothetical protein
MLHINRLSSFSQYHLLIFRSFFQNFESEGVAPITESLTMKEDQDEQGLTPILNKVYTAQETLIVEAHDGGLGYDHFDAFLRRANALCEKTKSDAQELASFMKQVQVLNQFGSSILSSSPVVVEEQQQPQAAAAAEEEVAVRESGKSNRKRKLVEAAVKATSSEDDDDDDDNDNEEEEVVHEDDGYETGDESISNNAGHGTWEDPEMTQLLEVQQQARSSHPRPHSPPCRDGNFSPAIAGVLTTGPTSSGRVRDGDPASSAPPAAVAVVSAIKKRKKGNNKKDNSSPPSPAASSSSSSPGRRGRGNCSKSECNGAPCKATDHTYCWVHRKLYQGMSTEEEDGGAPGHYGDEDEDEDADEE